MIKSSLTVILLLLWPAHPASAQVSYDQAAHLLTVVYDGVPVREVLAEISRKTGIVVYIDPRVDKTVFVDRVKGPVDEVLTELLKPLNTMLVYKGDAVVAVKVYDQSPADAMQMIDPRKSSSSIDMPSAPEKRVTPDAEQMRTEGMEQRREQLRQDHAERRQKFEERKAEQERKRKRVSKGRGGPGAPARQETGQDE